MPVYFIQAGERGPIKIGFSKDTDKRLAGLQAGHHECLRVLRTVEGGAGVEKWLHRRFAHGWLRGEWFIFDDAMLEIVPPEALAPEALAPPPPWRKTRGTILDEVIAKAGGVSKLAETLGIAAPTVSQWRRIPAERVLIVEKLTGISRHAIRPDIFGERA